MYLPPTHYVGFWRRVLATLIDGFLLLLPAAALGVAIFGWKYLDSPYSGGITQLCFELVVDWVVPGILIIFCWHRWGATPGKMWIHARIVDANTGGEPSLWQLIVRYLMGFPALLALGVGYFWVAFDERKQGWHDKLARTVVVRTDVPWP